MLIRLFALLAAAAPFAFADVQITTPAAGAQLTAGSVLSMAWVDSGTAPSISDLSSYQIFLCAGGNDATNFVSHLNIWRYWPADSAVEAITDGASAH